MVFVKLGTNKNNKYIYSKIRITHDIGLVHKVLLICIFSFVSHSISEMLSLKFLDKATKKQRH